MIETAIAHLQSLGFQDCGASPIKRGIAIKARTTKGWVHEKLLVTEDTLVSAIDAWASKHSPE